MMREDKDVAARKERQFVSKDTSRRFSGRFRRGDNPMPQKQILAGTGICIMCDDADEKTPKESSLAYMPHPALPSRQAVLCT